MYQAAQTRYKDMKYNRVGTVSYTHLVNQLLVVTFTRAAASEMKERIREALEKMEEDNPNDLNVQKQLSLIHNANISTIDSFCARVVKDNFDKIDLDPNFRIADENEIEMLQSDIVEEMLEELSLIHIF